MQKNIRALHTGYCPEQKCRYTIAVEYVEVQMSMQATPGHKKEKYQCEYLSSNGSCTSAGSSIYNCPLYVAAKYP